MILFSVLAVIVSFTFYPSLFSHWLR